MGFMSPRCAAGRALLVLMLLARTALAEGPRTETRLPPPDPTRGERADGKTAESRAKDAWLAVPRFLLLPIRLLFYAIEAPTKSSIEFDERHHISDHLVDLLTSSDGKVGIRPTFSWISGFRPSFGAHFFHDRLMGPSTMFNLDAAGGPDVVRLELAGRPTPLDSPAQVYFGAVYDRRNDWRYTGIGAAVPPLVGSLPAARYQQDLVDLDARLHLRFTRFIDLSLGGMFGFRRFANGEQYAGDQPIASVYCVQVNGQCGIGTIDDALVPGFNEGTQFLRVSAGLHLDLRQNPLDPVGALIDMDADYTHGVGSDDSSYFRFHGAVTFGINLWAHTHILVLRAATQFVDPINGVPVPFSELAVLGGPYDLRAYNLQAFRDFTSFYATAEYRWPILMWVDGSFFVDYGGVFGRWYDGFGTRRMQPDVGIGIRLQSSSRFYVRAQIAFGADGNWLFYLSGANVP
jgi:hypothetical protein